MKFIKMVSSSQYMRAWVSDDDRCEVHVHELSSRMEEWVYVSIYISETDCMNINVRCVRDGVSAFVAHEFMVIVARHQGATTIGPVEAQVREFAGQLPHTTDLIAFNRYKESQRRKERVKGTV